MKKDTLNNHFYLYKRFLNYISAKRKIEFAYLVILICITSIFEMISIGSALPFLAVLIEPQIVFNNQYAQFFISFFSFEHPNDLILPISVIFCLAAAISGLLRVLLLWYQTTLGYAIGADISVDIYKKTLYQPYISHTQKNSSEIISGVSHKANAVVGSTIMPFIVIFSSIFLLASILFVLIAVDPRASLLAFTFFGIIYGIVILFTEKHILINSEIISTEQNLVIKALQEGLGGIRNVLIDGTQLVYSKIFHLSDVKLRSAAANNRIISSIPRYIIEAFGLIFLGLFAYFISNTEKGLTASIPILGVLALGAQRLLPVMQQLYNNWAQIKGGIYPLIDTLDLLDQQFPSYLKKPLIKNFSFVESFEMKNVSFHYSNSKKMVLENLNFNFNKGETIGIIGETGCGKSTFLNIIMGLLNANLGKVKIDGSVLNDDNLRSWQLIIGHVPQDIFLADATIAENIAFGIPPKKINYKKLSEVAKLSELNDLVLSWKKGFQTKVGERGARLSGGQLQRIGIARALYKNCQILIFDEATSSLDNKTESKILNNIKNLLDKKTCIMVAHRISTLRNCDKIISFKNGQVKLSKSYEELIKTTYTKS